MLLPFLIHEMARLFSFCEFPGSGDGMLSSHPFDVSQSMSIMSCPIYCSAQEQSGWWRCPGSPASSQSHNSGGHKSLLMRHIKGFLHLDIRLLFLLSPILLVPCNTASQTQSILLSSLLYHLTFVLLLLAKSTIRSSPSHETFVLDLLLLPRLLHQVRPITYITFSCLFSHLT